MVRGFESRPLRHSSPYGKRPRDEIGARGPIDPGSRTPKTMSLREPSTPAPRLRIAATFAALAVCLGCRADRVLLLDSDPPGAQILLDGRDIGTTPLEYSFDHYGTRRVTLIMDGFLSHSEVLVMRPPWYGRFPFDLVSEILVPFGWRDEHALRVELEQGRSTIDEPDLESVLRRADTLRTAGPEGPRPAPPATNASESKAEAHP